MPAPRKPATHKCVTTAKPATPERRTETVPRIRLKLFGTGGAGGNAVTAIAKTRASGAHALDGVEIFAVDTDLQALETVPGADKIQLGSGVTRGLGAGGDAELASRAAQQDAERLEACVGNSDIVFITAGLGGGVGTGASPVLARLAKEQRALVVALVSLPFAFEGERRRQQAFAGLEQLKAQADAVICLPNDKLFKIVGESATVLEAFSRGNEIIATGVQALWQLFARKGLINLDFADLRATLGAKHCEGIFSYGEGEGTEKARGAVKALMESPLLDSGEALGKSEGVLVSILGGPDLTLAEVQRVVEPISRAAGRAHVIIGAAIDEHFKGKLAVTIIAAANILPRRVVTQPARPAALARPGDTSLYRGAVGRARPPAAGEPPRGAEPAPAEVSGPTVSSAAPGSTAKSSAKQKQETLALENVTRGRFDKSEPTIYNGEDLDVPTFIRRGVSLKR